MGKRGSKFHGAGHNNFDLRTKYSVHGPTVEVQVQLIQSSVAEVNNTNDTYKHTIQIQNTTERAQYKHGLCI